MSPPSQILPFALPFYARPGVEEACLRCQDEAGAQVNSLLFALWQAASGRFVPCATFTEIDRTAAPWRAEVVGKLRAIRRYLKPIGGELRAIVKAAELEAERQELETIAAFADQTAPPGDPLAAAPANLAAYRDASGVVLPEDARAVLIAAFRDGLPWRC